MTQSPPIATKTDHRNLGTDENEQGIRDKCKMTTHTFISIALSLIIILLLIIVFVLAFRSTQDSCPDDWIGFRNKCYYFSEEEGDWSSSRHNCVTQRADLTVIDTKKEMEFLIRHKCSSDHWIGLEMTENQPGRWVNGTIFNKLFPLRGNGKCAYLDDVGAATARCYTERKWICSRKMH
ncbi:C-type lectin domain family 2 member B isoform X2 [Ursus maritimus]|uniref:C-type lectin domain family 2 member B isoform X2 n=1 Tax=Ursus maritimus TaxID=29073 RepID=A0A8M1GTH3_URSMA|nr:C-type lectin domain family 2 member B isoform X2 [Ursus maritimus]XP_040498082.1 C-type lectin domain family 2 member B isoform X2 [Ursus maritimus]